MVNRKERQKIEKKCFTINYTENRRSSKTSHTQTVGELKILKTWPIPPSFELVLVLNIAKILLTISYKQ